MITDESIWVLLIFSPDSAKKKVGMERLCSVSDLSEKRPTAVILRRRIVSGRGGANMLPCCGLGSGDGLLGTNSVGGGGDGVAPSQRVVVVVDVDDDTPKKDRRKLPSISSLRKER